MIHKQHSESAKEIVATEEGGKRKFRKESAEDNDLTKNLKMGTVCQRGTAHTRNRIRKYPIRE